VGLIVTTLTGTSRVVVRFYDQRGTAEQWIEEGKEATHWTRLSWRRFRGNEVRLVLGVLAYNVGNLLRRLALPLAIQSWSLTSLQQRLFKTGGRLIRHARYFILQLAESQLTQRLFAQIIRRNRAARVASDVIEMAGRGGERGTERSWRRSGHHRPTEPEPGGGYESDQGGAEQSTCPRGLRYSLQQERLRGG
jgi:DDE family transposase